MFQNYVQGSSCAVLALKLKSSKLHTQWIFFYNYFGYLNEKPEFSHFFELEKYKLLTSKFLPLRMLLFKKCLHLNFQNI